MIASMTGFGRGRARVDDVMATVEMRSVNNRFCEVSVRLPRALAARENDVQALVKQAFERGRISVQIQLERTGPQAPVRVDEAAARGYAALLETLRRAAGVSDPVRLEHLLTFSSELLVPVEEEADEAVWAAVEQALAEAVAGMRTMRRQEGAALQADLQQRIDRLAEELARVEARAPERVREARQKLHDRLADLLGDDRLDPDRLEQEIALLADRLDVTEECVRLRSHLQLFAEALHSDEAVGRKLNFIAQEINREVNTIGSKANDAAVAHAAVRMKEELEKIREQVQNVE
ncbi:YicC family protein [Rhodothermaceae bacterium RA]|nr:YicC family protein [Rhodothermaceae bacterium RA]